ncbi:hypothetical protein BCV70DRAFT_197406 [Testicularia cyperi]|uniref:polynucleotide adenylyltransferase n=1 Tax=Testicularia cyperi TaxID=1882483 RepID=A0A317XZ45_9BASI|nr:hypothetical protein BCV70DRAFT_197406 [Testicularia cyperi]
MPAATRMARAFGADDFIAFDFDFDGDNTPNQSSAAPSPRLEPRSSENDRHAGPSQRRKRKADEREADGRTKKERDMARSRRTPWSTDVEWRNCRNGAEALHRELIAFDGWLSPTTAEHETRCMVIELISRAIKSQFRDAEVFPFGSQETKLYLPQGDLDLVVVSNSMENSRREGALRSMAACLRRHNLATNVQVIARAKVPIIKFVTTYARLKVDISVNQTNGLAAARYVNSWLRKWPHIRPLIMVIKHLLMQRGMSEVFSGGLGSYSVIIMVISFLQLHPKVQRGEIDPARNLGVLLLEFLELYGKNFGYDNCGISIRGRGGYFSKARRGWKDLRRPFMLCIEDPHDPANDISKGSFGIINVRSTLAGAFDILTAAICQQANESGGHPSKGWSRSVALPDTDSRGGGSVRHQRFSVDSDSDSDSEARSALLRDSRHDSGKNDRDANSLLGTILGISNPVVNQRKEMEALFYSGSLQFKLGRPAPPKSPPPARPQPPSSNAGGTSSRNQHAASRSTSAGSTNGSHHPSSGVVAIQSGASHASTTKTGEQPKFSIRGAAAAATAASSSTKRALSPSSTASFEIVDEPELAASQGFEFGSQNAARNSATTSSGDRRRRRASPSNDVEDEDSRYRVSRASKTKPNSQSGSNLGNGHAASTSNGPGSGSSPRKRPRISTIGEISQSDLENLSQSAPSTFVSDDDDESGDDVRAKIQNKSANGDSSDDSMDLQLPTISHAPSVNNSAKPSPQPRPSSRNGMTRVSSRTKNDFWSSKGVDPLSANSSRSVSPPLATDA